VVWSEIELKNVDFGGHPTQHVVLCCASSSRFFFVSFIGGIQKKKIKTKSKRETTTPTTTTQFFTLNNEGKIFPARHYHITIIIFSYGVYGSNIFFISRKTTQTRE
jgi:hypothetical protein